MTVQTDQCQTCTLDPNHCNGNPEQSETWNCQNFTVNRANIQKLIKHLQTNTPEEDTADANLDNRLFEFGSDPQRNVWDDYMDASEKEIKPAHKYILKQLIQKLCRTAINTLKTMWRILKLIDWHITHSELLKQTTPILRCTLKMPTTRTRLNRTSIQISGLAMATLKPTAVIPLSNRML